MESTPEFTRKAWLKQNTLLRSLSDSVLEAIATVLQIETLPANHPLALKDTPPPALYILYSGQIESDRTHPAGVTKATELLPGTVLYLKELLLDEPAPETTITLDECVLWTISRAEFLALSQQHPELSQTISRQLADELEQVSSQLAYERDRQTALRPYLVSRVKRGIVGSSRYAIRIRQDIKKAASDRRSVLVFGEPGLEKDNAVGLIHFGSRDRKEPLIKVNCNTLQPNGAELFGRAPGKPGLLDWIGRGTLLLNNLEDIPADLEERLVQLLDNGSYTPIGRDGEPTPKTRHCEARIMMTSERILSGLERCKLIGHTIKIPPLRVRKTDVANMLDYYLSLTSRARALPLPKVTPEALRRLQGYDFPGNSTELQT